MNVPIKDGYASAIGNGKRARVQECRWEHFAAAIP
jgi:hypothetical protein